MHELLVELARLLAEHLADLAGVAFERRAECPRLVGDHAVDGDRRAQDRVVEKLEPLGERVVEGFGALDQLCVERLLAALQRGIKGARVLLKHGLQAFGAVGEGAVEAIGEGIEDGLHGVRALAKDVLQLLGPIDEQCLQSVRAVDQCRLQFTGTIGQHSLELACLVREHGLQFLRAHTDRVRQMRGAGIDRRLERDHIAPGFLDKAGEPNLLLVQPLHENGDLVAHFLQREIDPVAGAEQGVALAGKLLQQRADANFVLAVRALEIGNLALHHRFEFSGAAQRPADGLVHVVDLPPDGLANRGDLLLGHAIGLSETDRDLGHRRGHQFQFLRPPGKQRQQPEQRDGDQDRGGEGDRGRPQEHFENARHPLQFGCEHGIAEQAADQQPGDAGDGCDLHRPLRRLLMQREYEAADRGHIVVGGIGWQSAARWPGRAAAGGAPARIARRIGVAIAGGPGQCRTGLFGRSWQQWWRR